MAGQGMNKVSLGFIPSPKGRKVPLDTSFFSYYKELAKLIHIRLGSLLLVLALVSLGRSICLADGSLFEI